VDDRRPPQGKENPMNVRSTRRARLVSRVALAVGACVLALTAVRIPDAAACAWRSPPSITGYNDPVHGTEYAFYSDVNGNLMALSCGPGGCWKSQQLAGAGLFQMGSPLVSFFDGNQGHLFFIGPSDHLYELYGNPPTIGNDLTNDTNPQNGGPSLKSVCGSLGPGAVPGTNLSAMWNGVEHVFWFDVTSALHETYFNGNWWDHIIGAASSAGTTASVGGWVTQGLSSLYDGTYQHVFYNDWATQSLWDTYFPGSCPTKWCTTKITAPGAGYVGGGPPQPGSPYPFGLLQPIDVPGQLLGGSSGTTVPYVAGPSSTVVPSIYTYAFWDIAYEKQGTWIWAAGPNNGLEPGYPFLYYTPYVEAFWIGTDNNVYNNGGIVTDSNNLAATPWVFSQSGDWSQYVLGAPLAGVWNNQMAGFSDGTNVHAFYIGADSNIHELYMSQSDYTNGSRAFAQHAIGGGGVVYH
jgi:hypothetical protein